MQLNIENLSLSYNNGSRLVDVLDSINLNVPAGGFVSLVGASGCGKTSILKLIGGLLQQTSGSIKIGGKTPAEAQKKREIGFVFQQPVLFGWRNVLKNVQLPGEILKSRKIIDKAEDFIHLVGLGSSKLQYPNELSGGMQSRVAIARALTLQPGVLLMDEPFADLDELTRERMNLELLRIWRETGSTIIFVTHNLEEAVFLSDTVHILGGKPATIVQSIEVGLPRSRHVEMMEHPEFQSLVSSARKTMRQHAKIDPQVEAL